MRQPGLTGRQPYALQTIWGDPPSDTRGLAMLAFAPVAARMIASRGAPQTLALGASIVAVGWVLRIALTGSLAQVIVGTTVAVMRLKTGISPLPGIPAAAFFAIPFFDMVVFAILVSTAIYLRRRLEAHKWLMTLSMITLLPAPIARMHFLPLPPGPPTFFALADLFIVAILVYDLTTRRKVHPATIWGGLLVVASQPLRLMIAGTSTAAESSTEARCSKTLWAAAVERNPHNARNGVRAKIISGLWLSSR